MNISTHAFKLIVILNCFLVSALSAEVKLPKLISDCMILKRNTPVKILGWAAKIENNKVVVWSENIREPIAVRYAWADNPCGVNLYNKEGLPASPFRTDNWNEYLFLRNYSSG